MVSFGNFLKQVKSGWIPFLLISASAGAAGAAVPEFLDIRGPASINRAALTLSAPSKLLYSGQAPLSPELVENYHQVRSSEKPFNAMDFIPLNLHPSSNSGYVFSAIADKSVQTILNQPHIRQSVVGQAADKMEKTLHQEVVLGGKGSEGPGHRLNFEVQAFQTQAQVRYEGLTKAAVSYQATRSTVAFEVFEKVARTKELVLSHELRPDERVSQMSVRWSW